MFNIDGRAGQQLEMTQESLDLILDLCAAEEPEKFEGEYWTIWPKPFTDSPQPWLKPLQHPHPPISIAGATPGSATLGFVGKLGLSPMSIFLNQKLLETHWRNDEKDCEKGGHVADCNKWTITREIIIADTDEDAQEIIKSGPAIRIYNEYGLPLYRQFEWLENRTHDSFVSDDEVDIQYCLKHHWLVGSPEADARKMVDM